MTLTKAQTAERDEAREALREMLNPGDTIYTTLRHVARSGMSRQIDVYVIRNNEPWRLTYRVAKACGYPYSDRWEALTVGGCGFDAGFDVVYAMGRALFPDHPDGDGGYALNHRWLG